MPDKTKNNLFVYISQKVFSRYVLLILPFLFTAFFIVTNLPKRLVIFPNENNLEYDTYNDEYNGGDSEIDTFYLDSNHIIFKSKISSKIDNPYAGYFTWLSNEDSNFTNLNEYDQVLIKLKAIKIKKIQLCIQSYIDGYTKPEEYITRRFQVYDLYCNKGFAEYTIPLNRFETPYWWYKANAFEKEKAGGADISKAMLFALQVDESSPANISNTLVVKHISFERNILARMQPLGIFLLIYITLFCLFYIIIRKYKSVNSTKKVIIPYEKINVKKYSEEEAERIAEYIASQYMDSYLTAARVANETGLLPSRIPFVLKETYNLNFKQYLNQIRIAEAKRLLKETDRQVVDIARTVGYNNATHFNRIFKQCERITPKEYRNNHLTPVAS